MLERQIVCYVLQHICGISRRKPQIFFVSVVEINCIFAPIVAQMLLN